MHTPKYIAIFHPEGNIAGNPHLSALAALLHGHGYRVHVYSDANPDMPYQKAGKTRDYTLFLNVPPRYAYFCIIGVDEGIIKAAEYAGQRGIPCLHISYEIFFDDELAAFPEFLSQNQKIRAALRACALCLLPDPARAALYCAEYNVPASRVICTPIAGAKLVRWRRSHYLHKLLQLPADVKILLHMGTISHWAMTDWLIERADTLPPGWVMVMHGRYGKPADTSKYEHTRVYYTDCPAENFARLRRIAQSAACCACLYRPWPDNPHTIKNIQHIGLSSGKFSTALQHGVPVLVQRGGQMAALAARYDAGIIIDTADAQDLSALGGLKTTASLAANCHQLFTNELSLQNHAKTLLDAIAKL